MMYTHNMPPYSWARHLKVATAAVVAFMLCDALSLSCVSHCRLSHKILLGERNRAWLEGVSLTEGKRKGRMFLVSIR